jgi:hypothetical protein
MSERRQTERAPCRLRCRIARGREQIPSRIVDVSEGGLCLVLPLWLKPKQNYEISIDVPGTGLSRVHAEIWHIRREESQTSSGRVWVAGAILVDSDEAFAKLLTATGVLSNDIGSTVAPASETLNPSRSVKAPEPIDTINPLVYRIRCKETGGPRTRILSLAADSDAQARSLATEDLGSRWTVLDIRQA